MIFLNAPVLILLLLIPAFVGFFHLQERQRQGKLKRIGDSELVISLTNAPSQSRRLLKIGLWITALSTIIIALARPAWGYEAEIAETEGITVLSLLDISRSMLAEDTTPSRLARAKIDMRRLYRALEGNDIGLILFAGTAYMYFPPTNDINGALAFLDSVSTDAITQQGTALDRALQLALDSFSGRDSRQLIIVIASDGENLDGDPMPIVQQASEAEIPIYAIGYGSSDGSVIPIYNEGGDIIDYQTNEGGELVLTYLDESTLQAIAEGSNGTYVHTENNAVEVVINQIQAAASGALSDRVTTRSVERFGIFVAIAVIALALDILIPDRSRKIA